MLLEFKQTPQALAAAFELQRRATFWNRGYPEERQLRLRAGLHVADVVADDLDVYGAGVNLVARIAGLARPGAVAASVDAVDEVLPGIDAMLEDGGLCFVKHIEEPVHVFHLSPVEESEALPASPVPAGKPAAGPSFGDTTLATCIAMAPIVDVEGSVEQRTLAQVIGDLLLTRLSTVPTLRVISRLSSEQFGHRGLDAAGIASHTGASYVIAGRLHGRGSRCRLFLELIDAKDQALVWANTVHVDEDELLAPDETVTPELAQAVVNQVVAHELRRASISALPNLASQTLHFSAIQLMHRQALSHFERSRELLEHLVERHPKAAAPHSWLAQWHVLRVTKGWITDARQDSDRALAHTRRALTLNNDSAMALAMEAFVLCHLKGDLTAAEETLAEAMALNPSEPWAWLVHLVVDGHLGRGEQAWRCAQRARELSPMDPLKHYFDGLAASAAVVAERYVDAERLARLALSKDPRHLPTLRALAIAQVHLDQPVAATDTLSRVLQVQPDFTLSGYVNSAPPAGQPMRRIWAEALREVGAPE